MNGGGLVILSTHFMKVCIEINEFIGIANNFNSVFINIMSSFFNNKFLGYVIMRISFSLFK